MKHKIVSVMSQAILTPEEVKGYVSEIHFFSHSGFALDTYVLTTMWFFLNAERIFQGTLI